MVIRIMLVWLLLASSAYADIVARKDGHGTTHFTVDGVKGLSNKDSLGYVHTQYGNGTKCVGKTDRNGLYKESCHD